MQEKDFHKQLVQRYAENRANDQELEAFFQLLKEGKLEEELLETMNQQGLTIQRELPAEIRVHRVHFLRTAWFRYAAAVILLLGIGGYLLWRESGEIPAKGRNDKGNVVQSEVSSTNNKAILTLADGSQIILDDKATGNIAQQGNTQIIKLDGNQLTYNGNLKKPGVGVLYNTITTPRGSQYQVTLPDGTKAWLNAASSLKFPTSFSGNERKVEATGEIYLEVAVNKTAPFVVTNKRIDIKVLGTSFNLNAYEDEDQIKTTLISGSIKVARPKQEAILKPGQQAQMNNTDNQSEKINIQEANVDQVLAWKNGLFNFEGASVKEVMNQLQRWYDIEVVYEAGVPDVKFLGGLSKNVKLPLVLETLSGLGVHFRIEGRRVIVMP